ncbi:enoyl-CoA hydratase/isomerase family protein [Bacillus sp. UNC41MFS5]|uniref:enoyl-CoA hydratase/isomerase family protein n=1 Tax=Bacillus sp. UNC41MFS5 TaxID=1449046 RepID=UPI00047B8305|nr:enoyl-CoA hydratase/isomerase family protein [Bacillus sp. UNC41MFS5]
METVKLVITDHQDFQRKTAHLFINSPLNLNAINNILYKDLRKYLEIIRGREDIGTLILSSEVTKAFSSGVDVKYIQSLTNEEAAQFFTDVSILLDMLAHFHIPTIAVINGYAFGAGADLALSCDLRIGTPSAVFRFPGPQFGLILGTQRLINEIGASRARYVTLLNKKIDAQMAKDFGLVHEICEDLKEAHDVSNNWAKTLNRVPAHAIQTLKELSNEPFHGTHELTRNSVRMGDFKQRFTDYVTK